MDNQLANDDADTQVVGRLLWEELHETQAPSRFEWNPADILQPSAGSLTPPSPPSAPPSTSTTSRRSSSTSSPTPEISPGFPVPSDLAQWRQRLFESTGETITMSLEQWEHLAVCDEFLDTQQTTIRSEAEKNSPYTLDLSLS